MLEKDITIKRVYPRMEYHKTRYRGFSYTLHARVSIISSVGISFGNVYLSQHSIMNCNDALIIFVFCHG